MITKNNKKFSAYLILFLSISFINWPSIAEGEPMNPTQEVRTDTIIGHGTIGVVCGKVQGTTLRGFCIFPKTTPLWSKRFGLKFKGGIIG